jgi:hypothetical protein
MPSEPAPDQHGCDSDSESKSKPEPKSKSKSTPALEAQALAQELISLSQNLACKKIGQSHLPVFIETLRTAKYTLTAVDASAEGTSALPDRESVVPNQKSWGETAARMGIKHPPKRKCLPKERGLTEQAIGVTKGRHRTNNNNPYSSGECSGKQAKSDALSAEANRCAQGYVPPSATAPA